MIPMQCGSEGIQGVLQMNHSNLLMEKTRAMLEYQQWMVWESR